MKENLAGKFSKKTKVSKKVQKHHHVKNERKFSGKIFQKNQSFKESSKAKING